MTMPTIHKILTSTACHAVAKAQRATRRWTLCLAALGLSSCTNVYQHIMDMGAVYPGIQVDTESFYNYKGKKYVKGCLADYRRVFTEAPMTSKKSPDKFKVVDGSQGSPIFREIRETKNGIYYAPNSNWKSLPIKPVPTGKLKSAPLPEEPVGDRSLTTNALWSYPAGAAALVFVDIPINAVLLTGAPVAIVCAPFGTKWYQQQVQAKKNGQGVKKDEE